MGAKREVWLFQSRSEVSSGSHPHHQPQPSRQGNPRIQEWAAFPFSRGPSRPRDGTGLSCSAGDSSPAEPPGKPHQPHRPLNWGQADAVLPPALPVWPLWSFAFFSLT